MYLKDINQVRAVEWGRTHLWDIYFSDDEDNRLDEFSKWFPASSVEEGLFNTIPHTFEAAGLSFALPKSQGLETLKITFHDSVRLTVHNWLRIWVKETIHNHGHYVSRLGDPGVLKRVHIVRVDNKHVNLAKGLEEATYLVFPQGEFHFTGDSEANPTTNSIELVIVSEIPKS